MTFDAGKVATRCFYQLVFPENHRANDEKQLDRQTP